MWAIELLKVYLKIVEFQGSMTKRNNIFTFGISPNDIMESIFGADMYGFNKIETLYEEPVEEVLLSGRSEGVENGKL
jgi:hypothetical protein